MVHKGSYQQFIKSYADHKRNLGQKIDNKTFIKEASEQWKGKFGEEWREKKGTSRPSSSVPISVAEEIKEIEKEIPAPAPISVEAPKRRRNLSNNTKPTLDSCSKLVRGIHRENELNNLNIQRVAEGKRPLKRLPKK